MRKAPTLESALWMAAGAVVTGVLLLLGWHFRQDPTQQLASKASRADLVGRIQLALASASEAEKSAVLAITDQDSQTFADQARTATGEAERERQELGTLLAAGGTPREREVFGQFSAAFETLRRVDDEVLQLAVKNTNLKAYALLFGPATRAIGEMDAALARLVPKTATLPDAKRAVDEVYGARLGVLRVEVLLSPHIAEESDTEMDRLEGAMTKEEAGVRKDLEDLAKLPQLEGNSDLVVASKSFGRFEELKGRMLALSRENTNVRSLALSLNQKRKAMLLCLESLHSLKQAILDEPIAGVTYGRPQSPR